MKRHLLKLYTIIFASPRFNKFNRYLFYLSLSGLGILNYRNDKISGEYNLINKILPRLFDRNNPIIFDIGANVGNYSLTLHKRFPDASIHAFEPHPQNFLKLSKIKNKNIEIYNIALGEKQESLTLYDRADSDGSEHASLYKEVITDIHKINSKHTEVKVDALDNIVKNYGIESIDFLKIDTEGNELAVLKGAHEMTKNGAISCIQFEFNEMNIISRCYFADFKKLLPEYQFYRLLPKGLLPLEKETRPILTELFAYQNIFAIHKSKVGKLS